MIDTLSKSPYNCQLFIFIYFELKLIAHIFFFILINVFSLILLNLLLYKLSIK